MTYMLIRFQVPLSLNVQAALQEVVPCEEVEEGVEVVAEERLEDEEDLEIGEEEEVLAEGVGVISVFAAAAAAAVAVETQILQDRQEDFEEGVHSLEMALWRRTILLNNCQNGSKCTQDSVPTHTLI